ncbi:MAG: META domain-containing protein, partial [Gemmatimonadota bacterium]
MQRLAFLVVALGLVACGDDDPVSSNGDGTRSEFASRVATKVAGRDWTLAAFAAGGRYTAALADRPITLQLTDDGQVRGSAGCNTYFGTYQVVEAGTISISGLAGTEMACYPESVMAQEAAYLQALAAATGMSLSDGQLRLLQGSGDRFLLFAAAADGAAPGNDTGGDSTAADTTTCESCGQAASGLVGRLWVARYFESGGGAEAVSDGVKITLSFGRDGRASGSAGCNQFSGRYRADDAGHLVVRDIAITEMYCQVPEVMEWENRFTALLGRADGFAVQGERLVLHAGDQALHLSASDEPSDPGGEPEWYEARAAAGEATVAYTVHACTAGDPATRSPEPLVLVADGDDLYFHQVVSTYCNALTARALSVEPVVDGSRITLNFTFRGPAVRCLCAFPVRGVIEGLAAGTYTVTA